MNEIVFNLSGASKHRWLPFSIRPIVDNSLNWGAFANPRPVATIKTGRVAQLITDALRRDQS